jgi:hypothetical protein
MAKFLCGREGFLSTLNFACFHVLLMLPFPHLKGYQKSKEANNYLEVQEEHKTYDDHQQNVIC